jgi:hypothetical protein
VLPGCSDAAAIFQNHSCALAGACHDANGSAANFNMATADWMAHLVGVVPKGGGLVPSLCATTGMPYIVAGSYPATGLFLVKLSGPPPCGQREPEIGDVLTPTELACVQAWADKLAAGQ